MTRFILIASVLFLFSSCGDNRGTLIKYGESELFYTDHVSKEDAERFGKFLNDSLRFFKDNKMTVALDKTERGNYVFKMVAAAGIENKSDYVNAAKVTARVVSEQVFNDAPVFFHFCDPGFTSKAVIAFDDWGRRKVFSNYTFYIDNQDNLSNAESLVQSFAEDLKKQNWLSIDPTPALQVKFFHGDSCSVKYIDRLGLQAKEPESLKAPDLQIFKDKKCGFKIVDSDLR